MDSSSGSEQPWAHPAHSPVKHCSRMSAASQYFPSTCVHRHMRMIFSATPVASQQTIVIVRVNQTDDARAMQDRVTLSVAQTVPGYAGCWLLAAGCFMPFTCFLCVCAWSLFSRTRGYTALPLAVQDDIWRRRVDTQRHALLSHSLSGPTLLVHHRDVHSRCNCAPCASERRSRCPVG